jgi:hypothetical protein
MRLVESVAQGRMRRTRVHGNPILLPLVNVHLRDVRVVATIL